MNLKKLQFSLFYFLIVLMPIQLGRHFWPDFSFVSGVRIDYLSPTLYFTDLLILGILFLEFIKGIPKISGRSILVASVICIFACANIYFSLSPAVSVYKWIKVWEIGFLVWFIGQSQIKIRTVTSLLLIPVFYESILAVWQFFVQQSSGFWWILGERTFNSGTPGIANTIINGQLWLRPYGTFSHPNVLGGFLAVVLPLVVYYFPHNHRRIAAGIVSFGFVALFLTMSRAAILVGLVAVAIMLARKMGFKIIWLICLVLLILFFGIRRIGNESFVVREQLNKTAIEKFVDSPIIGQGLGTSVIFLTKEINNHALVHQPTHNIYLLIAGEIGVVGLVLFMFLIFLSVRRKLTVPLLSICVLGMVDHYFLTQQQGLLLFGLVLGFCFAQYSKTDRIG